MTQTSAKTGPFLKIETSSTKPIYIPIATLERTSLQGWSEGRTILEQLFPTYIVDISITEERGEAE